MSEYFRQLGNIISDHSFFQQLRRANYDPRSDTSIYNSIFRYIDSKLNLNLSSTALSEQNGTKKSSTQKSSSKGPNINNNFKNKNFYELQVDKLLESEECKNWLHVAQALQLLNDILKPFMIEKMTLLYNHIIYVILHNSEQKFKNRTNRRKSSTLRRNSSKIYGNPNSPCNSPRSPRRQNNQPGGSNLNSPRNLQRQRSYSLNQDTSILSFNEERTEDGGLIKLTPTEKEEFLLLAFSLDRRRPEDILNGNNKPKGNKQKIKIPKHFKDRNITASAVNLANAYIMMSVMKNALEGAFDRNSFENSKKTRNEDICFKDFDTPSVLHVIRNNEVFGDFWINGSIEMTTLINQVIFIRNKVIHSDLKIPSNVHAKMAIQIILHLCKSFRIEHFKREGAVDLSQLDHSQSSVTLTRRNLKSVTVTQTQQQKTLEEHENFEDNSFSLDENIDADSQIFTDCDTSTPLSSPRKSRKKSITRQTSFTNVFKTEYDSNLYIRRPSDSIKMIECILKRYDHIEIKNNTTNSKNDETRQNLSETEFDTTIDSDPENITQKNDRSRPKKYREPIGASKSNICLSNYQKIKKARLASIYMKRHKNFGTFKGERTVL